MTKGVFDITMSVDGYITAANQTAAEPMGAGGDVVHNWVFADDHPTNRELVAGAWEKIGAVIAGRVTYDTSVPWWKANGPSGPARRPVFVVTHEAPAQRPEGGVYEFVTGGIEEALRRAKAAAGNGVVTVMGGASLGQQFIQAGLIDEVIIHLVPVCSATVRGCSRR